MAPDALRDTLWRHQGEAIAGSPTPPAREVAVMAYTTPTEDHSALPSRPCDQRFQRSCQFLGPSARRARWREKPEC